MPSAIQKKIKKGKPDFGKLKLINSKSRKPKKNKNERKSIENKRKTIKIKWNL